MDERKYAAQRLIDVSKELEKQASLNDKIIEERKITSSATCSFSVDILKLILTLRDSMNDQDQDVEDRMRKSLEVLNSIVEALEAYPASQRDEIIKLEATQEGMRRALEAVRATGENELEALMIPESAKSADAAAPTNSQPSDDIDWDDDT
jgi:hypothetical protein